MRKHHVNTLKTAESITFSNFSELLDYDDIEMQ